MAEGRIKLRVRNVAYEHPGRDEESISDPELHCVDSEIRLSGEDGETYRIDCAQMGDSDWIVVFREVVIDVSSRRPRVVEIRGTKSSVYCWANGDDRVIVQGTRPEVPANIKDSPAGRASKTDTPSSGVVNALKGVGVFLGATLILSDCLMKEKIEKLAAVLQSDSELSGSVRVVQTIFVTAK